MAETHGIASLSKLNVSVGMRSKWSHPCARCCTPTDAAAGCGTRNSAGKPGGGHAYAACPCWRIAHRHGAQALLPACATTASLASSQHNRAPSSKSNVGQAWGMGRCCARSYACIFT